MEYYKPFTAWSLFTSPKTSRLIEEYPVLEQPNVSLDLSLSLGYKDVYQEKNSQVGESSYNNHHHHHHHQRKQLQIKNCRGKNNAEGSSLELSNVSLELSLSVGNASATDKQNQSSANLGFDDTRTSKKRERMENPSATRKASSSRNKRNKVKREENDPWCIKKHLTESDLGGMSRLLLASELVRSHVFPSWDDDQIAKVKEGLPVSVYDCDTRTEHKLVFKQWNNAANVLINNWIKGFKNRRELKAGDEIGLYWDTCGSRFNFSVLHRAARI